MFRGAVVPGVPRPCGRCRASYKDPVVVTSGKRGGRMALCQRCRAADKAEKRSRKEKGK